MSKHRRRKLHPKVLEAIHSMPSPFVDPDGSYTGLGIHPLDVPTQDVDDL